MALDPVLQQLIDQLPTVPPGPVDYPSLRQQAAAMIPLIVGPGGRIEVASVEDRQIEAGGEIVPLRIYRPATKAVGTLHYIFLLYTSPSPRDRTRFRMTSSA